MCEVEKINIKISRNPGIHNGEWCIFKTRIPLKMLGNRPLEDIFNKWSVLKNKILSRNPRLKRYYNVGKRCEICNKPLLLYQMVAHHRRFKKDGGKNVYKNYQIRCRKCEAEYHKKLQNLEIK